MALKDGRVLNKLALFQATKFVIICYGNKQANINTFINADGISILSIDPIMSFITFAPCGLWSHIVLHCHIFLISFNWIRIGSVSWHFFVFYDNDIFEDAVCLPLPAPLSVERFSFWVCLMFPCD